MMDVTLRKRAEKTEDLLEDLSVAETMRVPDIGRFETTEFLTPEAVRDRTFQPCEVGYTWSRQRPTEPDDRLAADATPADVSALDEDLSIGTNVWLRLRFTVPPAMAGQPVWLRFAAIPLDTPSGGPSSISRRVEATCYRDGVPWQAFDGGRSDLLLTDNADGDEEFNLLVELGTTSLWGGLNVTEFQLSSVRVYSTRERVQDLYRNVRVLNDLRKDIDDSPNHGKILQGLYRASTTFPFQADDDAALRSGAEEALAELDKTKESLSSELSEYTLSTIGHAHIDVAWRWPWSETVRKCARSFSNTLTLMDEYDDFTFMQSQPVLYEFTRQRYPNLFKEITERVEEGRWEPEGALWLESDINIPSGEALARQYLVGKRYFREEFDVDPKVTFLPDVFGYSPGLPGIAQDAGCPYFFTQKISWNETNEFPHNTFTWEGIDGSEVLAHFPPADTYNGKVSVGEVRNAVTNFAESDTLDESAYLVGWGDGGGGVTREMLEDRKTINEIGSLPDVEFDSLENFFERLEPLAEGLETWRGELYFERHRGTLTSQGRTKHNNRRGEFKLREAEIWAALAMVQDLSTGYPKERLDDAWRILLFNQFHDILPGSSITDVYRDADREYELLFEEANDLIADAQSALLGDTDSSDLVCVTNSLSWSHSPVVNVSADMVPEIADANGMVAEDSEPTPVQPSGSDSDQYLFRASNLPSMGAKTFVATDDAPATTNPFDVTETRLENDVVCVEFTDDGRLASVYDKENDRELLDGSGNRLVSYRDQPAQFDAWDIEEDVYAVGDALPAPTETEVIETGPVRAKVRQTRRFGDSTLAQDVVLYRDSKRIDFRTFVDWQEEERLLKAHFPVAVHTDSATYETHFGHFERSTHSNTSWDAARFEEPHQKWVDVAEYGAGAAVLNDSRYGVHVDGSDVSLSLLRAPTYPDPEADRGKHTFTYSFLPHAGDFREAGVVEAAYDLNAPTATVPVDRDVSFSAMRVDDPGVVVEAVKRAEDDVDALVVRLYEAWGRQTDATLDISLPIADAATTNIIEDEREVLSVEEGSIPLSFDAFEIKSVVLSLVDGRWSPAT